MTLLLQLEQWRLKRRTKSAKTAQHKHALIFLRTIGLRHLITRHITSTMYKGGGKKESLTADEQT